MKSSNLVLIGTALLHSCIISTAFSQDDGWPYDTSGHAMLIAAITDDMDQVKVGDPYIQWQTSGADMIYAKDTSVVRQAIYDKGASIAYII